MGRNDRRQVGVFGGDPLPFVVVGGFVLLFMVLGVVWLGGTVGAWASGAGWHPPRYGPSMIFAALRGQSLWPGASTGGVLGGIAIIGALAVTAATVGLALLKGRLRATVPGLATLPQVRDFTHGPRLEQAVRLRPELKDKPRKEITGADVGLILGYLEGTRTLLRASFEDVMLILAGPRSGKTSRIVAMQVLEAIGFCLVTSVRSDAYAITGRSRERCGKVFLFDPQGIAHRPQKTWWDMLGWAGRKLDNARRVAKNLSKTVEDPDKRGGDAYFTAAGQATLTNLLYAAGLGSRPLSDLLAWSTDHLDSAPVDILREHGLGALADSLRETAELPDETRRGVYGHVQQALMPLYDPEIARWVTRQDSTEEFVPEEHVGFTDTLYLLSKKGGGGAAGIIASLTDACIDAAVTEAEATRGGRIQPPPRLILDEAANVCKIEDLPDLYSTLGGMGIQVTTILQSYDQGVDAWGRSGMKKLWGAATVKLVGAGLDDYSFVDQVSQLVGMRAIVEESLSTSRQGASTTRSRRRERIIDAAEVRELERSTALMFATSTRPAMIRMPAWFEGADADRLSKDKEQMDVETERLAAEKKTMRSSG
ncbi:type IV secretory system conjugative DNA transfer family protein [Nocardiopsis dassonvillei]|uniref:type IV secretory system conjugative DNA transfer family protein n=1 Tax=Nocardiopsis dassonvillei TaxID=2014 RepID=UPI0033C1FBEC